MKNDPEPTADLLLYDPRMEMSQLIYSDAEACQPDSDDSSLGGLAYAPGGGINDDLDSEQPNIRERQFQQNQFALDQYEDMKNLQRYVERRNQFNSRKSRDVKINNSFTGPYPLDPNEFNHNNKGTNAQFAQANDAVNGK